jgi:hypothetical protein
LILSELAENAMRMKEPTIANILLVLVVDADGDAAIINIPAVTFVGAV